MARVIYSQDQINEFIATAEMMGVAPAIRQLGYPTYPTAQKWFEEQGKEMPSIDSIGQKAAVMRVFYGDQEKKYAAQRNIERIVESLEQDQLDAKDINLLSNALHKAVQTFNLIEGKSTSITESHTKDGADLAINDLLNSAKAKNALVEEEMNQ
jgi:hypothetical protein